MKKLIVLIFAVCIIFQGCEKETSVVSSDTSSFPTGKESGNRITSNFIDVIVDDCILYTNSQSEPELLEIKLSLKNHGSTGTLPEVGAVIQVATIKPDGTTPAPPVFAKSNDGVYYEDIVHNETAKPSFESPELEFKYDVIENFTIPSTIDFVVRVYKNVEFPEDEIIVDEEELLDVLSVTCDVEVD